MAKKRRKRLHGRVEKVIKPVHSSQPEMAQIEIKEAEHLYREIRVENEFIDEDGDKAPLTPGAEVNVIVEADTDGIAKKPA